MFSKEVKRLAKILHLRCTGNHIDYCGWFYGEGGRSYYYKEGMSILLKIKKIGISLDKLEQLMLVLYPGRENWLND